MSVTSAQNNLRQIERQIERLEKNQSDSESKAVRLDKQIISKETEISRCKSASLISSKKRQLESLIVEQNKAKKAASETRSKLVSLYDKRRKAETTLREEQQKENNRETLRMHRRINELTEQLDQHVPAREPNMIMRCVRPIIERYPKMLDLYDSAAEKYEEGGLDRNALDDMRLCFEMCLQELFSNEKSLENQIDAIGGLLKGAGVSSEFRNLLNRTVDYYSKYQNNHVKHGDDISPYEVGFVIELTCILMKQMIEQFAQNTDDIFDTDEKDT